MMRVLKARGDVRGKRTWDGTSRLEIGFAARPRFLCERSR